MAMNKTKLVVLILGTVLSLGAAEADDGVLCSNPFKSLEKLVIQRSVKVEKWVPEIVADGDTQCIRIQPGGSLGVWLDLPEGETILFSIMMKYQNVKRNDPKKHWTGAVFKAMVKIEGEKTVWPGRVQIGTSDWKQISFKVNVPLGKKAKALVQCAVEDSIGTALYKNLTVRVLK